MASAVYSVWLRAGRPFILATPLADLQRVLQGYGFTVYAYPDNAHLTANPPEDHTPFSATGWPVPSPRWYGLADDIMPRKPGGMAELTRLARQIIRDKDAGVPGTEWIKYINWTDESGKIWHTQWEPNKRTVPSGDAGHIHISGRSDMATAKLPKYDPIARMSGGGSQEDEDKVGAFLGPFQLGPDKTSHVINPVSSGGANPRPAWLNMGLDSFGVKLVPVRVYVSKGDGNFGPLPGYDGGVVNLESGKIFSLSLEKGVRIVSYKRMAYDASGKPIDPTDSDPAYAGSISVGYELGAMG